MLDLEKCIKLWSLENPELIAETFTSDVYKVTRGGDIFVLKLLNKVGVKDESHGIEALKIWNGEGAVKLVEHSENALLLEYISGPDLKSWVLDSRDEEATKIIAETLNKLHITRDDITRDDITRDDITRDDITRDGVIFTPSLVNGLILLEDRFYCLLNHKNEHPLFEQGANLARDLLANQTDICVLHGDMHFANMMLHPSRGWLTIDPKGLYGDRAFDMANTLYNPYIPSTVSPQRYLQTARILSEHTEIALYKILSYGFAYGCLSLAWHYDDKTDGEHSEKMLQIAYQIWQEHCS